MRTVTVRKGCERRISLGHLWIFSNEIEDFDKSIPAGADVRVRDARGNLLGSGTWSPSSLISVRLHARAREESLCPELIAERVRASWAARQEWFGAEASACRIIYAEGDGLPGLVVDRLGEHLSVQCLTAAMEGRIPWVLDALESTLRPSGIVLRNDSPARALEGLPRSVSLGRGEVPERVSFRLHGLVFCADPWGGQKTGFFLDQRENYRLLERLAPGARVLDAFCYSGAWGLHARRWGAGEVTYLDASEEALALVAENLQANGLGDAKRVRADALAFLKSTAGAGERFDLVVLDPPAFVKSKARVREALKGYLNLNKWGMRCVGPGGCLVTCSCSHHVSAEAFVEMAALSAREAGREVRVLGVGRQAPDHPWLPAMPETAYLKVLLLQVF